MGGILSLHLWTASLSLNISATACWDVSWRQPVDPFPALVKRVFVSVEASDRYKHIRVSRGSRYVSEEVKHGEFGFRLKPHRSAAVAGVFSQNVRFCQLPVTRLLGSVAQSGSLASWVCTVFWTRRRETLRKPWLQVENVIASACSINIHALWSHFHLSVCLLLMEKMKRPADLMNSAARITTASPTTGGATARTTVETTRTRRTAVSTWLQFFYSFTAKIVNIYRIVT